MAISVCISMGLMTPGLGYRCCQLNIVQSTWHRRTLAYIVASAAASQPSMNLKIQSCVNAADITSGHLHWIPYATARTHFRPCYPRRRHPTRVFSLPVLISLDGVGVHQCFVRELQHIGQGS